MLLLLMKVIKFLKYLKFSATTLNWKAESKSAGIQKKACTIKKVIPGCRNSMILKCIRPDWDFSHCFLVRLLINKRGNSDPLTLTIKAD